MIIYNFIPERVEQVECSNGINDAQNIVDNLYAENYQRFMQYDEKVEDICYELCRELLSIFN
jgi:hypothetical protein